jgi:hypothetical protein
MLKLAVKSTAIRIAHWPAVRKNLIFNYSSPPCHPDNSAC